MQMILIERFYLPTANIIRTKAKVRVSLERLAHGLWKICRVQR